MNPAIKVEIYHEELHCNSFMAHDCKWSSEFVVINGKKAILTNARMVLFLEQEQASSSIRPITEEDLA